MRAKLVTETFLRTTFLNVQFEIDGKPCLLSLDYGTSPKHGIAVRDHVECLLSAAIDGNAVPQGTLDWLATISRKFRARLRRFGLVKPEPQPSRYPALPQGVEPDAAGRIADAVLKDLGVSVLHRCRACRVCGQAFVGPCTATACSQECRTERLKARSKSQTQRRSENRKEWNARKRCGECWKPIAGAQRSSKDYCSPACRQKAYRYRKAMKR